MFRRSPYTPLEQKAPNIQSENFYPSQAYQLYPTDPPPQRVQLPPHHSDYPEGQYFSMYPSPSPAQPQGYQATTPIEMSSFVESDAQSVSSESSGVFPALSVPLISTSSAANNAPKQNVPKQKSANSPPADSRIDFNLPSELQRSSEKIKKAERQNAGKEPQQPLVTAGDGPGTEVHVMYAKQVPDVQVYDSTEASLGTQYNSESSDMYDVAQQGQGIYADAEDSLYGASAMPDPYATAYSDTFK